MQSIPFFALLGTALKKTAAFLKHSRGLLAALVIFITVFADPAAGSTDSARLVAEDMQTLADAGFMGQGLTNDGTYYYTCGAFAPIKFTMIAKYEIGTLQRVRYRLFPVGMDMIRAGYDHIGGISYYNGKIYAGVESSDYQTPPCIAVYNADTLRFETSYVLPLEKFPDGCPFVAVDPQTGLLYTCAWSNAPCMYVYDTKADMAYVQRIDAVGASALDRIQGGEFYNGTLYLSHDKKDGTPVDEILSFDPETGEVQVVMVRDVGKAENETEDLTVFPAADGSLFHVADYNKTVSMYLRHYAAS